MMVTRNADPEIIRQVLAELFTSETVVRFDPKQCSVQKVDEEGVLSLGWRYDGFLAPSIDALLHEMCHFVEIDEARMNIQSWGVRYPNIQYAPNRYGWSSWSEPRTMQITARELRVVAFQHHVHDHFGLPTWRDSVPDTFKIHPDWYHVPGKSDESRARWMLAHYDRLVRSGRYRYDVFLREWRRRNAVLANRPAYRAVKNLDSSIHTI